MEKVVMEARYAVRGNVRAELLWSDKPISFWGTVDPKSGQIRDNRHPNYKENMAGKVFAFPTPKGSSGTGLIIMEQVRNHCAPAAMINIHSDPVVLTGPLIVKNFYNVTIPTVNISEEDYMKLENAAEVEFFEDRDEIHVYYLERR